MDRWRQKLRDFADHWSPRSGYLPQAISLGFYFDRDCWPEKGWCYTEIKGSRILMVGPFELWLEL